MHAPRRTPSTVPRNNSCSNLAVDVAAAVLRASTDGRTPRRAGEVGVSESTTINRRQGGRQRGHCTPAICQPCRHDHTQIPSVVVGRSVGDSNCNGSLARVLHIDVTYLSTAAYARVTQSVCKLVHTAVKKYPYIDGYFVASFPHFNATGSVYVCIRKSTE